MSGPTGKTHDSQKRFAINKRKGNSKSIVQNCGINENVAVKNYGKNRNRTPRLDLPLRYRDQ